MTEVITVEITNKKGLHARAAAKFVKSVSAFDAKITVVKIAANNEEEMPAVGGASILGLLMLGADAGSKLRITADGHHAKESIDALQSLIEGKFGEGE